MTKIVALYISITNDWIFWWWIVKDLSLISKLSNDVTVSLWTIVRALSCSLFNLSLICLPWNIHTSGQYSNSDSINALKRVRLFLKRTNVTTLVKALSFLFAFKQIFVTYSPNLRLLFFVIPGKSTSLLSQTIS